MKGIIINLFESFISEKWDDEILEALYIKAGIDEESLPFIGPESYEDSQLTDLVTAASEILQEDTDTILFNFGRYSAPVLKTRYPEYFENVSSLAEVLNNLNRIHYVEVNKLYSDTRLPEILLKNIEPGIFEIHYKSPRKLCSFLHGIITGIGDIYREEITIEKNKCFRKGSDEYVFILRMDGE